MDEREVVVLGLTPLLLLAVLVGFVTGTTIFFLTRLFAERSIAAGSRRQSIYHKPGVIRPLLPNEIMTELLEDVVFIVFVESKHEIPGGTIYPALRNLAERHPLLNARIVTDTTMTNKECRYFEEITENKSIDFEDIRTQPWEEVLRDLTVDKIDSSSGPLWRVRFVTVHGSHNISTDSTLPKLHKYALILNFHHSISDGACLPDLCSTLIKDVDTLLSGGDIDSYSPRQMVHIERLPIELRRPAKWRESLSLYIQLMKDQLFGTKNVYLESFPPREHESPAHTKVIDFHLPTEETEQLKLKCHANCVTVHGALTAAAVMAIYKLCETKKARSLTMHTMHAINIRNQCRPPVSNTDLGSLFTGVFIDLSVTPHQDFWTLAQTVANDLHSRIKAKKHLKLQSAIISLMTKMSYDKRVEMMLADDVQKRKVCISMSNMGVIEDLFQYSNIDVTKFLGCTAEHRLPIGSVFGNVIATFRGQLNWTVSYHTNITSEAEAMNYRDVIKETLLEAIQN